MSNRDLMLSALKKHTFPLLKEQGFTGKHPHFRRKFDNYMELISFFTNKWGCSFVIEVAAVFPDADMPNYAVYEGATEETFGVEATNYRYRLPGMYNGWFHYRDVYEKRSFFFRKQYYDVPETHASSHIPPKGYKLVQKFNKETAEEICQEINKQLEQGYQWLRDFELKFFRHYANNEN